MRAMLNRAVRIVNLDSGTRRQGRPVFNPMPVEQLLWIVRDASSHRGRVFQEFAVTATVLALLVGCAAMIVAVTGLGIWTVSWVVDFLAAGS